MTRHLWYLAAVLLTQLRYLAIIMSSWAIRHFDAADRN